MNSVLKDILQRAGVEEGEKFASSGAEKTAAEKLASFRDGVNELAQGLDINGEMAEKFASEAIGGRIAAQALIQELGYLQKAAGFRGMLDNVLMHAGNAGQYARGYGADAGNWAKRQGSRAYEGAGNTLEDVGQKMDGALNKVTGGRAGSGENDFLRRRGRQVAGGAGIAAAGGGAYAGIQAVRSRYSGGQ
jgi:hypothetical protein